MHARNTEIQLILRVSHFHPSGIHQITFLAVNYKEKGHEQGEETFILILLLQKIPKRCWEVLRNLLH